MTPGRRPEAARTSWIVAYHGAWPQVQQLMAISPEGVVQEDGYIESDDAVGGLREALEDAADDATLLRLRAENAGGEAMPAAFFDRMLDGESPVRVWREFRGLKARELAEAAGLSAAYLSDIETNRKPGSARALRRLAEALRVEMDELVVPR